MQLRLYIYTVKQILSHTCRWTPRPARGVPEGSKRSISPKTNKPEEAYEGWDGGQREDGEVTAPTSVSVFVQSMRASADTAETVEVLELQRMVTVVLCECGE